MSVLPFRNIPGALRSHLGSLDSPVATLGRRALSFCLCPCSGAAAFPSAAQPEAVLAHVPGPRVESVLDHLGALPRLRLHGPQLQGPGRRPPPSGSRPGCACAASPASAPQCMAFVVETDSRGVLRVGAPAPCGSNSDDVGLVASCCGGRLPPARPSHRSVAIDCTVTQGIATRENEAS